MSEPLTPTGAGYRRSRADEALIRKLTVERDAALKDAADWRREFEMYSKAWLRELGGKVFNKAHRIDALVLTTRWFREGREAWEAETKRIRELRRDLADARTIGIPLEPIFAAFIAPPTEPTSSKGTPDGE